MFVKVRQDMTHYQIKSLYGEPDSDTGDVEIGGKSVSPYTGSAKGKGWNHNPWRRWRGDTIHGDLEFSLHYW